MPPTGNQDCLDKSPPHIFLTPPIEVSHATNAIQNFITIKFWQIFKLSHSIVMGGEAETMYNQITFIFSKEQHGTILSMHLTKFRKSEK